jgi:hypothetical protein
MTSSDPTVTSKGTRLGAAVRIMRPIVVCLVFFASFPAVHPLPFFTSDGIDNLHVENIGLTQADVVWTTAHPSTSLVVIAESNDNEPNRWVPPQPDRKFVTEHRVTVTVLLRGQHHPRWKDLTRPGNPAGQRRTARCSRQFQDARSRPQWTA